MFTRRISVDAARQWLGEHARHYESSAKPIFAIALYDEDDIMGVVVGGETDGKAELCHIYTNGAYHGYSILYGTAWRAFKALGFETLVL